MTAESSSLCMKPVTVLDKVEELENPAFDGAVRNGFGGRNSRSDLADLDKCG